MQLTKKQFFVIALTAVISTTSFSGCKTGLKGSAQSAKQNAPVVEGSAIRVTTQELMTEPIRLAGPNSNGFPCVRIPAIIKAPNGDLLAFWDGRPDGCPDAPAQTSIVMRRSANGGTTWEDATIPAPKAIPSKIVTDAQGNPTKYDGYTDPSIVVDYITGKIFLFAVLTHGAGLHGGLSPDNPSDMKAAYFVSEDNGRTWTGPVDVTQAFLDAEPNSYGRWASAGQGIQLITQPYKGRLIIPFVDVVSTQNGRTFKAVNLYSDDYGKTWKAGQGVRNSMDENKVVELSDGRVLLNSRRSDGVKNRWVAISNDGGHSYTDVRADTNLIDPNNNASILRAFPEAPATDPASKILLFSNTRSTDSRTQGTISVSYDEGKTWASYRIFRPGTLQYTTMVNLGNGEYGILIEGHEGRGSHPMDFVRFNWAWVSKQEPASTDNHTTAPR